MKYVLDASIGIKWVMNEIDSATARQLREDFRSQIHELIAPDSFPLEAAHALTTAARRGVVIAWRCLQFRFESTCQVEYQASSHRVEVNQSANNPNNSYLLYNSRSLTDNGGSPGPRTRRTLTAVRSTTNNARNVRPDLVRNVMCRTSRPTSSLSGATGAIKGLCSSLANAS